LEITKRIETMTDIRMIGKVKGNPKRSLSKHGVPLCTLDISTPKKWTDAQGKVHVGRDYLYRVRYSGEMAKSAAQYESGDRVLVVGRIDEKNYLKNWERERKYWAYILGTEHRHKKKVVIL